MVVVDIHLEGLKRSHFRNGNVGARFRQILDNDIPVAVSPSLRSYLRGQWDENPEIIELVREIVKRKGSVLGQQGLTHICSYKHDFVDPYHEFYCLWTGPLPIGRKISKNKQKEWMEEGRNRLEKLFGVNPELFVPPNHYFDETTLEAALELGYRFFADKAVSNFTPYSFGRYNFGEYKKLIVVPEGNLCEGGFSGSAAHIHYDEIDSFSDNYDWAIKEASSLLDVKPLDVSYISIKFNNLRKYARKRARDMVRATEKIIGKAREFGRKKNNFSDL